MMCLWKTGLVMPITSYANAGGTGNRTSSITVTQVGGGAPSSGTIDNLVDGGFGNNSTDSAFWSQFNATNMTLEFDFGSPKYIDEFKVYNGSANTWGGSWIYEAYDGASWVAVSAGFAWTAGSGATQITTGTITNFAGYQKYRLRNTSAPSNLPWIQEIEFKIAPGAM